MTTDRLGLLRGQFDLTWALFEYHLERLEEADFRWEPVAHCWTVREDAHGRWVPDWADTEPDPVPMPTIAWLTWHIGWWWETATSHVRGVPPRDRTEITWPGPGEPALAWLRSLREEWLTAVSALSEPDLDTPAAFPDPAYTRAQMIAWVNAELMKNVAEIGQLRLLRAAGRKRQGVLPTP
nr:DinB family protein [Streptomyces sp. SBE_14.2]